MKTKGIIAITILALLAVPVTLCAWGFFLPAVYSDTFMGELSEKVRLLNETEEPRIIVLGGSAAAFGVDSDYIESELEGYRALNFGMYAGLGTRAMMDISRRSLRRGDIVIVMPEQQSQSLSCYFGAEYFWQAADGHFGLLTRLSRDGVKEAVSAFPAFAAGKCRYAVRKTQPVPDSVYRKSTFSENGNIRKGIAVGNRMPGGYDPNTPIVFDEAMVSPEFVEILNEYTEMAARRGAVVYYHFPPMNAKAVCEDADIGAPRFTDHLTEILVCGILGDPQDSIMDCDYFFDTNFHLTDEGREVFTGQLIRDLKAEFGDYTKTVSAAAINSEDADADSSDSQESDAYADDPSVHETEDDFFVYEIQGDVAALSGLTEEGRKQISVRVPSEAVGHPVAIIRASAFAGHVELQSIRISAGVRVIEDGAFAGCENLREIVMESSAPEKCLVGNHLLDGTDAEILVPSDSLTAYRLNYNWSSWADRIQPYDR